MTEEWTNGLVRARTRASLAGSVGGARRPTTLPAASIRSAKVPSSPISGWACMKVNCLPRRAVRAREGPAGGATPCEGDRAAGGRPVRAAPGGARAPPQWLGWRPPRCTAAMLPVIAAADRRIRLLHQLPQGIVAALNKAIAEARAPYLARLDADDRARPDRLGKQFTFMQAHPEIGLLGTFAERIDAAGNVVGRLAPPTDPARLARVLARTNPFVHSSVMMRTALVRRSGGYPAAFRAAGGYDLWLGMAEGGGIRKLAGLFTHYPWDSSN